ncbi:MAG: DMT family transporter, partial [Gammaproteobacteria bacterium]|nr:DMT family transporter [Gammaproteobacteria bacterium]
FAYAGYLLAVERARGRADGFTVMLASTVVAALLTGAVALALGEIWWPASGRGWLVLAGLALLVHVVGQGGIVWAVGRLPAPLSSVVILIQPVVATGLGWLWLGEALGPASIASGALVLAGVLIARRQ